MNASTTRGRTGRDATDARYGARTRAGGRGYSDAPVDGANALQIDYAEPLVDRPVASPPERRRPRAEPQVQPAPLAPPAPVALPRAPFLILVVGLVIAGVMGVLVLNTKINENSFVLDDLQAQQQALDLKEQQLSQQLEDVQSPGSLRAAAKRLGLVPAGTPAFITLPDGKVVGVPSPATAPNSTTSDR